MPVRGVAKADRWLWVWLSRRWNAWRTALVIVKPETVVAWHRQGFRWYWRWKRRRRTERAHRTFAGLVRAHAFAVVLPDCVQNATLLLECLEGR